MRALCGVLILMLTACSTAPSLYRNYELRDWSGRNDAEPGDKLPDITFSASRFTASASGSSPCGRWRADVKPARSALSPAAFANARRVSGECPDQTAAEIEQMFLAAMNDPKGTVWLSGNKVSIEAGDVWFSFYDKSPRRFFGLKF